MNSLWDIRIFLGLVPKESPCMLRNMLEESRFQLACFFVLALLTTFMFKTLPYFIQLNDFLCDFVYPFIVKSNVILLFMRWETERNNWE
jgi:hypothetical protein